MQNKVFIVIMGTIKNSNRQTDQLDMHMHTFNSVVWLANSGLKAGGINPHIRIRCGHLFSRGQAENPDRHEFVILSYIAVIDKYFGDCSIRVY